MANTRGLRRRIRSVKNTAQITKAMQMVSATKMRKAQNQALSSRPYVEILSNVLSQISQGGKKYQHFLLEKNNSKKVGVVLFSTDKGLCGALNTNLFRTVQNQESRIKDQAEGVIYYSVGKKGRDFIVRTNKDLKGDFENHEHVSFEDVFELRKYLISEFKNDQVGEVYLLYPDFISTLRQEPKLVKVLPIKVEDLLHDSVIASETRQSKLEIASPSVRNDKGKEFLFEPDINSLLDFTLTHFIDNSLYKAFLESRASEHSARMIAMQNATDNAKDLVQDLTLTYNQVRQENITRELLEIISAGAALE